MAEDLRWDGEIKRDDVGQRQGDDVVHRRMVAESHPILLLAPRKRARDPSVV
jgi:hypothetical protein